MSVFALSVLMSSNGWVWDRQIESQTEMQMRRSIYQVLSGKMKMDSLMG